MNFPLPTLAPVVNSAGISAPPYSDIYQSLIASFQAIYGTDIYIAPDSQDGQWLAVLAAAINDSNQAAIAVFQAYSPFYAQGAGLSSQVKINGLAREIATNSQSQGNVVGQVGTVIVNGVVKDENSNLWNLPASVTIPVSGVISVTVVAQKLGAIIASAGTINSISNPQLGWQSFVSTVNAEPGAVVESDAALRARQVFSTALPSLSIKNGIEAAIGNVNGVTRFFVYENDTGITDINGIPAHSISPVVEGGLSDLIGKAIQIKKPPGIQTYGSTPVVTHDSKGFPITVNYFILAEVAIYFEITIKALDGYLSSTGVAIRTAVMSYVNGLAIGEDVYPSQVQGAASLIGTGLNDTFYITAFKLGLSVPTLDFIPIVIAFNKGANNILANTTLIIAP